MFDEESGGAFKSETHFALGKIRVDSIFTGHMANGQVTDFDLEQTNAVGKASIKLKAGQITIDVGKKHVTVPYKYSGDLYFLNYHPEFFRKISDAYRADPGGTQTITVFSPEAAQAIPIKVTGLPARVAQHDGKPEPELGFRADFGAVNIDFYTHGDERLVAMNVASQGFQIVQAGVTNLFADPIKAHPELSQATFGTRRLDHLMMTMRDGVKLVGDAILPDKPGKYPVILERTPYGRGASELGGEFYASRGYVFFVQDTRGRGDSDGTFDPLVGEREDGYDTVQWIAKQPWCDGRVGMIGASYGGYVQWAAAVEQPPALKCIVPQVSPPDAFYNLPYEYGTFFLLGDMWWLNIVRNKDADFAGMLSSAPNAKGLLTLPIGDAPRATFGYDLPMLRTWLARDRASKWKGYEIENEVTRVKIPVLQISGWWDGDGIGTMMHWTKLSAAGKKNQWLIEGPWTHAFNTTTKLGEYNFGASAIRDLQLVYLRFFDTWLKGKQVGWDKTPKATVFYTGENKWRYLPAFPEPGTKPRVFYLSAGRKLGARPGVGSSRYVYDPSKAKVGKLPTPGSTDISLRVHLQKPKDGMVFFQSAALPRATVFEGPIRVDVWLRTDVVDTDLFASVVDVYPDGKVMSLSEGGKLRLAYRNGFSKPELMKPGAAYRVTLHPWWIAHQFGKGHRIGLIFTSSGFPAFARNLNTGESPLTAKRMVTAHIELLHDKKHPSTLTIGQAP